MKNSILLLISALLTAWVLVLTLYWPDLVPRLIVCDVGQGDGIILSSGFTQVLIDTGPDDSILQCLQHFVPVWDTHIELVVITHMHADHYGGFAGMLKMRTVGRIWFSDLEGESSKEFTAFREAVIDAQRQGTRLELPFLGRREVFQGGTELAVVGPLSLEGVTDNRGITTLKETTSETILSDTFPTAAEKEQSQNDRSIVLFIRFQESTMLLTGDMSETGEQALIRRGLIDDVDALKVGHHGSKTSSSASFLARASPEIAVISVGKNNQYKHPSPEVMMRFDTLGAKTYRTDEYGSIQLLPSGNAWRIVSSR